MSTQVFLRSSGTITADRWGPGITTWNPASAYSTPSTATLIQRCSLSRGASSVQAFATSIASSTAKFAIVESGNAFTDYWVTPPLDRDVTIAATVTMNFWALESSMSANACMGCSVYGIHGTDGSLYSPVIADNWLGGTELGTSAAVQNFTAAPTSTAVKRGDRLLIVPFFTKINASAMGGPFTLTMNYDGPTAGANGDSYVTFTEDFGFMTSTPPSIFDVADSGFTTAIGDPVGDLERYAQKFYVSGPCTVTQLIVPSARAVSAPVDSLQVSLQADSSGSPSGTILGSTTKLGSTLSTSIVAETYDIGDVTISSAGYYWVVLERTGSGNATQYYHWANANANTVDPALGRKQYIASAWGSLDTAVLMSVQVQVGSTTLYPTTTAGQVDPNGGTHDSKEAWTSRGAGTTNSVTNTSSAPASPILATVSAGGNFVEWYSRKLQAFTLAGPVLVNLRALESTTGANATVGVEIAVVNADGTSAVAWGYTLYGIEVTASEAAYQFFVSGDDVAVTDGQRLRLRVYSDDSSAAAMAASLTTTIAYAGTSGGASGDTYLTLDQTLTEYVATGIPAINMARTGPA